MKCRILYLFLFSCLLSATRVAPQTISGVSTTTTSLSATAPATTYTRFIVRNPAGLAPLQQLCLTLGCNVAGGIDGSLGKLFLVTAPSGIDPNAFLQTLRSQPGVTNAELDALLKVMQSTPPAAPSGLWDSTPMNYFGTTVWHGYVAQPAGTIVRLPDTQSAFNVTGTGIVADIDTGVDPNHPVLQPVLLPGYDFIRNQPIGSEMTDFTGAPPPNSTNIANVNQSTAAVLDQSTAAVLDGGQQYAAFGHGTMVAGIIHLVAPTAQIMPLKAFRADGSSNLFDILRAVYFAVDHGAKVINMSFSMVNSSPELTRTINYAAGHGVICVSSAGNTGKETLVFPAGYRNVIGVASTNNLDVRSTFSNFGHALTFMTAPGEGIIYHV